MIVVIKVQILMESIVKRTNVLDGKSVSVPVSECVSDNFADVTITRFKVEKLVRLTLPRFPCSPDFFR